MTSQHRTNKPVIIFTACLVAFSSALVQGSPRGDSAQARDYSANEVQALRDEVTSLRRQVRLLREQTSTARLESETTNKRGPGVGDAPVEQGVDPDAEAARLSKRFAAINEQFDSEDVDAKWAYVAEYRVREAVERTAVRRIPNVSIACRATLCRLEVKSRSDLQLSALGQGLVMELSRKFPRGLVHRENTDSGMSILVVYLAREGRHLPQAGE